MPTTKVIDNFSGKLTRNNIGDINSGLAKFGTTFGSDPFSNPGNLTWMEKPTSILTLTGAANPITALKPRMESGTEYVYGVTGSNASVATLYKIQVNTGGASGNPNTDSPSIIAQLGSQSPSFRIGPQIQFYGTDNTSVSSTLAKLFIGGDGGITKVNSNGSGETPLGYGNASIVANVPRPVVPFLGKLYFANGNNIGEIDSTETITTYGKLSPALPFGTFVRDLDVSPDGNYLQITSSSVKPTSLDANSVDTNSLGSTDSAKYFWNGTDTGATSSQNYPGYALTANTVFSNKNFTLGYDVGGAAVYEGTVKKVTLPKTMSPNFGAVFSTGNLLSFATTEYDTSNNHLKGSLYFYGQYDDETPNGLFRPLRFASGQGTDVVVVSSCVPVSNLWYVPPYYNYTNNIGGAAKVYFTTSEIDASNNPYHVLYKFTTVPTGNGSVIAGVYETQQETSVKLFRDILKKKLKVSQVRVYTPPLVANNSFQIDLIGPGGTVIPSTTGTFTVGTNNIVAGQTVCNYNPTMNPSYSVGLRVTNLGIVNWVAEKIELDIDEAGQF